MLTSIDQPIIRRALMRRLDSEPGVRVLEIKIKAHRNKDDPHIRVGLNLMVDDKTVVQALFDLRPEFYLVEVHNQADEIANQCKEARAVMRLTGDSLPAPGAVSQVFHAKGTGLRGSWGNRVMRSM